MLLKKDGTPDNRVNNKNGANAGRPKKTKEEKAKPITIYVAPERIVELGGIGRLRNKIKAYELGL